MGNTDEAGKGDAPAAPGGRAAPASPMPVADPAASSSRLEWEARRAQELLAESKRAESTSRELRSQLDSLRQEVARQASLLAEAQQLIHSMEMGMRAVKSSISLQLGYLLTSRPGSPKALLALPLRVFRLLREGRRRRHQPPSQHRQLVAVPLPQEWFSAELRAELGGFHARMSGPADAPAASPGGRGASPSPGVDLTEVRVAAIMDEFTFSAFRECCELQQLTPEGWGQELDALKPHLLFIESAWDGAGGSWQRKISNASEELRELIAHCRKSGIPVVFWSKEDPVHFKTFLATARLADVVFTTDIDCIKHYKTELGHERVYLLPFATQPLSHHPLERYTRKPGFCFAGSYYVRYPVRQRDFASLIQATTSLGQVDIYDRNHGKDHPNYTFPAAYSPYILGSLPFDQIDLAYKGYEFGININTVKHSQSMFARRVFDLLASNTTTVSNYARGLRLMFGDLVISSDDSGQLKRSLAPLMADPLYRRKHRLAGLRKVMQEHTYQHRLGYVLGKVYGQAPQAPQPEVVVLARVDSDAALQRVLASFRRQAWSHKQLVLCFGAGYLPEQSPVADDIRVLSAMQAGMRTVSTLSGTAYVAGFHDNDYYGPHYLIDLLLATSYSPSPAIGKAAHYVMRSNAPVLESDGAQYRGGQIIARRRGIAPGSLFVGETVVEWLDRIDEPFTDATALALDEFNYCALAGDCDACAEVDDLAGLDHGMPAAELLRIAEGIHADSPEATHGSDSMPGAGLPGIEAAELSERLGDPGSTNLTSELDGGHLVLQSRLPIGQHAYAYFSGQFTPAQLRFTDIARMQLVCDRGSGLELVLVYKNAQGEKISHSILKAAQNVTAGVPPGTHAVEIGLRVSKAGEYRIRRLVFDHVPLSVATIVTRSRTLLLAKNYPSYDDLYKHAFVHRRVIEYRRHGVDVDVFRIGGSHLSFYEFDGVDVAYGQADHLRAMLNSGSYDTVLVHVMDERMWAVLQEFVDSKRIYVWAHGSEMQSASRRECDQTDDASRTRAIALGEKRMRFWRRIFDEHHPNLTMIFVSAWSASDVMQDVGVRLPESRCRVIHNFVDGELFKHVPKAADQRKKILSIRPFASRVYANDLTVQAILLLTTKPFFGELEFRIIGDGPLFEETVAPLAGFGNVVVERRFLAQAEIAQLHRQYGTFLVPSRMDSHGVSRDEAMASGLVPITNRVAAIPEFVDESCGLLAEPEDAQGLADAIERLYRDPELFQRLSLAAARRVREQSGFDTTIKREIDMLRSRGAVP